MESRLCIWNNSCSHLDDPFGRMDGWLPIVSHNPCRISTWLQIYGVKFRFHWTFLPFALALALPLAVCQRLSFAIRVSFQFSRPSSATSFIKVIGFPSLPIKTPIQNRVVHFLIRQFVTSCHEPSECFAVWVGHKFSSCFFSMLFYFGDDFYHFQGPDIYVVCENLALSIRGVSLESML